MPFPGHKHLPFDLFACDYVCRVDVDSQTMFIPSSVYKSGTDALKLFFMLNSTEHETSTSHKKYFCFKCLSCCIYHADEC